MTWFEKIFSRTDRLGRLRYRTVRGEHLRRTILHRKLSAVLSYVIHKLFTYKLSVSPVGSDTGQEKEEQAGIYVP